MDVIFEPQSGKPFCIEVGFFDTVLEIKEKVQKYQGIPVTSQTLVFNGQVLEDERDVEFCEILHNSHIQLILAWDVDDNFISQLFEELETLLNDNAPSSTTSVPLEMDADDTVLRSKDNVQDQMEMESVPVYRPVVIQSDEHQLTENNVADVNIMPPPTSSGKGTAGATTGSKKLKLTENNDVDVNIIPPPPPPMSLGKEAAGATTGSNTLKEPTLNNAVDVEIMPPPPTSSGNEEAGATTGSKKLKLTLNNAVDVNIMPRPPPPPMSSGKGAAGATTVSNTLKEPTLNNAVDVNIMPPPPPPMSSGKGEAGATTGSNTLKELTLDNAVDVNIMPSPTSSGKEAAGASAGSNILKLTWKNALDVNNMPPPPPTSSGKGAAVATKGSGKGAAGATTSSGKLKLFVLPRYGTKKVAVEVNSTDNVEELRKELENLQKRVLLPLPEEGYFFIHKQRVMDDDQSFRWHQVRQGDTIEIFNGYITRGLP